VADDAPTAHVSIGVDGRFLTFDTGAEAVFGHRAEDVIGKPMAPLIIPEPLRSGHEDGMARFLRTREPFLIGRTIEITALHADGSVFPVQLTLEVAGDDPLVIAATIHPLQD
jgi:PAS domain S-box-containing protein